MMPVKAVWKLDTARSEAWRSRVKRGKAQSWRPLCAVLSYMAARLSEHAPPSGKGGHHPCPLELFLPNPVAREQLIEGSGVPGV